MIKFTENPKSFQTQENLQYLTQLTHNVIPTLVESRRKVRSDLTIPQHSQDVVFLGEIMSQIAYETEYNKLIHSSN